jgi:thiol-disulfide isomerase/thioredoxin
MNNNGIFCDKGKDIISVDVFDASGMYISNSISCEKVNDAIIIECNDIYFYVTSIDSFGNNIRIKKLNKKPKTEYLIKVVNIIPNVEFENLSGEKVNLQSFLNIKKYVYIEFWATWCPPCVEGVDYLNEAINTRNDLIIIALNANEEKNEIKNSLSKYDIKCIQGLSNPLVEKNLHQNGYPYGVLFNKEGYPVRFGVDPKNLLNEITEYEKK